MHHGRRRHYRGLGRRWYERENVLERLENYQRDLEQELADVSDLIERIRAGEASRRSLSLHEKATAAIPSLPSLSFALIDRRCSPSLSSACSSSSLLSTR